MDLPRLKSVGYGVVGLSVATSWPDVGGSLSRWHFRSLGLPASAVGSPMAIAGWLIDRIERWCAGSEGELLVVRSVSDLRRCLSRGGPVGIVLGVQGGHALDGDLRNVGRLWQRGVRMFAPAHVMDNDVVGSGTGGTAGGLSDFGRDVVEALEDQGVIVDLAHMSLTGIEETMPLLRRPFAISHTALRDDTAPRPGLIRRYNASTRNVPDAVAREVGARGGLLGVVMATQLLGGTTLNSAARMIRRAFAAAGDEHVAIGSDMDGALRMLIDCEGLPALADSMLAADVAPAVVEGFIGGNAARFLQGALPA